LSLRRSKSAKGKSPLRSADTTGGSATLPAITPAEVLKSLLWLLEAIGISRREVLATVRSLPLVKLPAPVTVVSGQLEYWSRPAIRWAADPRFLGVDGRPRDLAFMAGDPSFSDLVALELPRERPAICRDILLEIDAIVRLPNGRLRWRERAAVASGAESGVVLADEFLRPIQVLLNALQTNLLLPRVKGVPKVAFQRAVSGFEISPKDMVELQGFVARHGLALLETVDDWLADRQRLRQRPGGRRQQVVRPYLGLYLSTTGSDTKLTLDDSAYQRRRNSIPKTRKIPRLQ
jgi:hypothetical protein